MNEMKIIIIFVTICVGFHASHWKCFKYFYQIVSMWSIKIEGSWFAWVPNFLYVYAIFQYFQMPEKNYTFHQPSHLNIWIAQFSMSRSSNSQTIWHVTLVYPLWVQIYENYGYLKNLGPFYKPYDYNFKRINFKLKNIGGTRLPPC
jgi:hypothetical protein